MNSERNSAPQQLHLFLWVIGPNLDTEDFMSRSKEKDLEICLGEPDIRFCLLKNIRRARCVASVSKMVQNVLNSDVLRPFMRQRFPEVICHGLVKCTRCHRLWNRDPNAASNIWVAGNAAVNGNARPQYLGWAHNNQMDIDEE